MNAENQKLFEDIERYVNDPNERAEQDQYILFTEDEYQQIIIKFLEGRQEQGLTATEEEVVQIIRWAERVKVDISFLELFMKGFIILDMKDGEPTVKRRENGPDTIPD